MLAIIKGGHRIRGNGYEQKLYFRGHGKYSKYRRFDKKISEEECKKKKESMSAYICP